jgi:hypothetical protein
VALRYKPEGRGFDSRESLEFFVFGRTMALGLTVSNPPFLGGKGGRCVGLTTLPSSCADCLEIWEPQPPRDLRACPDLYRYCSTFIRYTPIFPIRHHPQSVRINKERKQHANNKYRFKFRIYFFPSSPR